MLSSVLARGNILSMAMRAAVGVFAMVVVLMRVGFRGAEIVAEGRGSNKEEEEVRSLLCNESVVTSAHSGKADEHQEVESGGKEEDEQEEVGEELEGVLQVGVVGHRAGNGVRQVGVCGGCA